MSSKPPCFKVFNPLPNDKIVDVTKLKTFADNKSNITYKTISLYDRVENTVGKGENAGYQHFLLFPQCFPKPSWRHKKSGLCDKGLKLEIVWERFRMLYLCVVYLQEYQEHWKGEIWLATHQFTVILDKNLLNLKDPFSYVYISRFDLIKTIPFWPKYIRYKLTA